MANLLLGPMLRHVAATTATVWVETDEPCEVCVLGHRARTFTVWGHHYALVVIEGLRPGETYPYDVTLDGDRCWPPVAWELPPSIIRTLDPDAERATVLFGSCRAAAPHTVPYVLRPEEAPEGRGVDTLRAFALRMSRTEPADWPDLLVLIGDQVYADDASPGVRARLQAERPADHPLPPELVADFEQYTWLYREAWSPELERWLFSVLPSVMLFDDHDMIDDWNISDAWVREIRRQPWWEDHVVGGLVSFWLYQHLGNLSPQRLREEGLLERVAAAADAGEELRAWARRSESFTPVPGGYQFSFARELGPVHLIMVDARNGRVLEPGARRMLGDEEWAFVVREASRPCRHLLLATSLPAFVPGGLHGVQQWNEAVCDGAWGRLAGRVGERLRRALDMEDWAAFDHSFRALEELLLRIGAEATDRHGPDSRPVPPPATINVLSGDIHFAYLARVGRRDGVPLTSRIHQIVSSPIRNVLPARDRRVLAFGASAAGRWIGARLQHLAGRAQSRLAWGFEHEPVFANNIGLLRFAGDTGTVQLLRARLDDDGEPELLAAVEAVL
ncbi:MAG: alkaline phosphatase family protein [Acidimicrobiia bacterium]